jgi:hypothetical protein
MPYWRPRHPGATGWNAVVDHNGWRILLPEHTSSTAGELIDIPLDTCVSIFWVNVQVLAVVLLKFLSARRCVTFILLQFSLWT